MSPDAHWPASVTKNVTVEAFTQAYGSEGYETCPAQDRTLDIAFEKVAVYVDAAGAPTHAARQLTDGSWTSKLGEAEDICHATLEAIEDDGHGLGYGKVAVILRRPR